ncbi:MAG: flippase-like domain-containing protein [Sedimentisphaerales bacterium]|nr:flippase-like domain-containing protein [Sedimentisphaerales bacterium]
MAKAQDAGRTRYVSLAARIIVAVVAIGWVLYGQDWAELGRAFRRLSLWYFALSLATFAATQLIIAFRWWLLLRAQSICIAVRATVRLHFLGLFYNNVMPGSVGGDLLKAWYVTKHTDKRLAGALSVFVDRVIGLVGLVLMAILAYLLFARGSLGGPAQAGAGGAGSWLGHHKNLISWVFAGVVVVLVSVLVQPYGRARLRRAWGRALHRGVGLLLEAKDAALVYCSKPLTVLWAMLLTVVAQGSPIVTFWLLGRSLGVEATLTQYLFIFPVTWVVGALPISIAGLGVVEAGTVALFVRMTGTPEESAFALVLCQRLIWVVASLPGAAVHLLGYHLPGELC